MTGTFAPDRRRLRRRTRRSAFAYSLLFAVVSSALIIILGNWSEDRPVVQTISFAIVGAVLQTAILGLLYEVLLRDDVENQTLDKLNLSLDVRRHGLLRMSENPTVDWASVLDGANDVVIISSDPSRLLGAADQMLLQTAGRGRRRKVHIAIPRSTPPDVKEWSEKFEDRWKQALPDRELIGYRVDGQFNYEIVSCGQKLVVVLPAAFDAGWSTPSKLLEFTKGEKGGIGAWLDDQINALGHSKSAPWGHRPSGRHGRNGSDFDPPDAPEETLT